MTTYTVPADEGISVAGSGDVAWIFPANITTDDANSALAALPGGNDSEILAIPFDLSGLPSNATQIDGLTVRLNIWNSAGLTSARDTLVQWAYGAADLAHAIGDNNARNLSIGAPSSNVYTYGGAADKWGGTWTREALIAADMLYLLLQCDGISSTPIVNLDYAELDIDYSSPAGPDQDPPDGPGTGAATIAGSKDTYLQQAQPTVNQGSAVIIRVEENVNDFHGLLSFPLGTIGRVSAAHLQMRPSLVFGLPSIQIARMLQRGWEELEATWNNRTTGKTWASGGASTDGTDYTSQDAVLWANFTPGAPNNSPNLAALVNAALSDGQDTLDLRLKDLATGLSIFSSREGGNPPVLLLQGLTSPASSQQWTRRMRDAGAVRSGVRGEVKHYAGRTVRRSRRRRRR